jgi:hypothetical protein
VLAVSGNTGVGTGDDGIGGGLSSSAAVVMVESVGGALLSMAIGLGTGSGNREEVLLRGVVQSGSGVTAMLGSRSTETKPRQEGARHKKKRVKTVAKQLVVVG